MNDLAKQAMDYYHQALLQSDEARIYLEKRGVYDEAAIKHFELGFSDGSFSKTLPNPRSSKGKEVRALFKKLGFMNDNGHDKFRPCIVFPVFDELGVIVQVYGRKITNRIKSKRYHEFLTDDKMSLWNLQGIKEQNEVILCKGLMDALTFWVKGYRNVTSVHGVDAFTDAHARTIKNLGANRVYIAFGNDHIGNIWANACGASLQNVGIVPMQMRFPQNTDPNLYAMNHGFQSIFSCAKRLNDTASTKALPRDVVATPKAVSTHMTTKDKAPQTPNMVDGNSQIKANSKTKGNDIYITFGQKEYRVKGLFKNNSIDSLKINLRICVRSMIFVDNLELYSSRQRQAFVSQAALELGVEKDAIREDLGKLIVELEKIQDARIHQVLAINEITPKEKDEAIAFLQNPSLIHNIKRDLDASGLIGETHNKLVGYLAMVSRKLAKPLAVLVQSTSAAGKSTLLETLLSFMPPEETMKYSSITPQSLYYMADKGIRHKVLAVSEDEGASRASYSLKLLQSEGELMISSTGGDSNGLASKEYKVEGPVCIAMTTTAIDIDEELLNRCIVLTVDETRTQTKAIHEIQRQNQTLEGILKRKQFEATLNVHRNAQRLLRPVYVVNPYAPQLTFLDEKTRLRRDHMKYLSLIQAVAFLHQFQRPIHSKNVDDETLEYIEVTLEDIRIANQLAHHVLGTTLDELPPQTRKLLEIIHTMVKDECRSLKIQRSEYQFTRKTLREYSQWGDTQLKIHLKRLVEHEYLALNVVKRKHLYECLYNGEGQHSSRFLMGLIDTKQIHKPRSGQAKYRSDSNVNQSGHRRVDVGAISAQDRA